MTTKRTWEETIKFDSGLTIGQHCIELEYADGSRCVALVEISKRGIVKVLTKPDEGDMYSSWSKILGDHLVHIPKTQTIVWGARNPEFMRIFDNPSKIIRKTN